LEIDVRRLVTIFLRDDDNPHRPPVNLKVVMVAYVMQLPLVVGQAFPFCALPVHSGQLVQMNLSFITSWLKYAFNLSRRASVHAGKDLADIGFTSASTGRGPAVIALRVYGLSDVVALVGRTARRQW
jgi:hypothetical protein